MRWFHPYKIIGALLLMTLGATVWVYQSGQKDDADFYLKVFSAFGVLFVVLLALYGEAIKNFVDRIDLRIDLAERADNFQNLFATNAGAVRVLCHHLRVVNRTPYRPVVNCRVWLVKIQDEVAGEFKEQFIFAVPRLMEWAPSEVSPDVRSFSEDQVFDFGKSFVDQDRFDVSYYKSQGGTFRGSCATGQSRRYIFRITADNCIRSKLYTVEVRVQNSAITKEWPYKIMTDIQVVT